MEFKTIDIPTQSFGINNNGLLILLNGCQLGSDYNNRVGRKIVNEFLDITGMMFTDIASSGAQLTTAQVGRMIVLVDYQSNGAAPAVTDILESSEALSQLNLNNRDRFEILSDESYAFDHQYWSAMNVLQSGSQNCYSVSTAFSLEGLETIFNSSSTGLIGDISSGALYLLLTGTNPSGDGTDAVLRMSSRVRFVDC